MARYTVTVAALLLLVATPAAAEPGDTVDYGDAGIVTVPPQSAPYVAPGELVIAPDGSGVVVLLCRAERFGDSRTGVTSQRVG